MNECDVVYQCLSSLIIGPISVIMQFISESPFTEVLGRSIILNLTPKIALKLDTLHTSFGETSKCGSTPECALVFLVGLALFPDISQWKLVMIACHAPC